MALVKVRLPMKKRGEAAEKPVTRYGKFLRELARRFFRRLEPRMINMNFSAMQCTERREKAEHSAYELRRPPKRNIKQAERLIMHNATK